MSNRDADTLAPLTVGGIVIEGVLELPRVPIRLAEMLPASSSALIDAESDWLAPRFAHRSRSGDWIGFLTFQSYLVRTAHHTILVDTCVGNHKDRGGYEPFHGMDTPWLDRLAATGVAPEQVDFVMCTHMHPDHIGWNTRLADGRWVPTFPRARYVFARREYEHRRALWERDGAAVERAYTDSVLPVVESGQAVIVESDHALDDQVCLEAAHGHTPGNVVIRLRDGAAQAVLSGDVLHHPLQVRYPEWSSQFCEDPQASAACRREFVTRHADTDTLIVPAHFPAPTAGRIRSDGERWRYDWLE
jgi:glyoxylase-like metal-dependent hydrolase (beta-lactamase superfamily II)